MTNKISELDIDPRWKIHNIDSFDYFESLSSKIMFRPEVPTEVVKRFEVVKNLINHSYFVYDFLDAAFERALSTLELALKKRYEEIEKKNTHKSLNELMNWADVKGLFESPRDIIDSLRKLRNEIIGHPNRYNLFGNLSIGLIFTIVNVINGLYEDIRLRKFRKSELKIVNKHFKSFIKNGSIFELNNDRLIIFLAKLLYLDNKQSNKIYYFLFYPIFDLTEKENSFNIPEPIIIEGKSWNIKNNQFIIKSIEKGNATISKISDSINQIKFIEWLEKYYDKNRPVKAFINVKINEIYNLITNQSN